MHYLLKVMFIPLIMLAAVPTLSAYAQTDESSIKAQWINDLIPYIKWTGRSYKELTICTIGSENVNVYLKEIIQKEESDAKKRGKTLPLAHVEKQSSESDFTKCHILYIGTSEQNDITSLLDKTKGKQILTVSSLDKFADKGGIVEFVISTDGVVIRINEKPAENAKIIIDSDLLGFAKRIYK